MRYSKVLLTTHLILILSSNIYAEVMDKEISITGIWNYLAIGIILGVSLSWFKWWIGLPIQLYYSLVLFYPIMEWNDKYVGPAIAKEAGNHYGKNAYNAFILLVVTYLISWLLMCFRKMQKKKNKESISL